MRAVVRASAVGLLTAVPLLGGMAAQAAQTDGGALLRLAHLSPDTPAVDVYVDSVADPAVGVTLPGVGYGTVSEYRDVAPGAYAVSMRAAGADPSTPPVLSTTVQVEPGSARTVAGVGYFSDLGLEIIEDSLQAPPAGQARVRVVSAAASAENLDVGLPDGPQLAADLAFASTGDYVDVPAGPTTLQVAADGAPPTELPVEIAPGAVYSLLVLDGPQGGLTVQPVLDAASEGLVAGGPLGTREGGTGGGADGPMPVGGVDAGAGGTAGSPSRGWAVAAVLSLVVLTAATASRHRPPAGRHGAGRHASRSS
ncbi:DUF4397 domain-containing protein [Geodermatophilus sp. YIM 151500]|uniref:DUF4397 domain-containing protein n=1 Tax=Geodermatophilus sp. YIM 151500 TaxID=2984531 RepID=UPI0021E5004C|nr:DUF4397 domain-containing protein [Geodermatophilus sp. YIM 151500]MCV2488785.1 DUF4397 domain-containing protein [Geodermatophilus sp. YIM 151500]